MKSQHLCSILVLLLSLSACVPPPRTSTPVPTTEETAASIPTIASSEPPTDVPLPTNTPPPSVQIIELVDEGTLGCDNSDEEAFCQFHVQGKIDGVSSFSDYRVYVFVFPVNPPGEGWYLQKSPAIIESNGDWEQSPAYLGNVDFPAVNGNTLKIRAVLIKDDATINGTKLEVLVKSNDLIVLSAVEDIDGDTAISDTVDLTVDR